MLNKLWKGLSDRLSLFLCVDSDTLSVQISYYDPGKHNIMVLFNSGIGSIVYTASWITTIVICEFKVISWCHVLFWLCMLELEGPASIHTSYRAIKQDYRYIKFQSEYTGHDINFVL